MVTAWSSHTKIRSTFLSKSSPSSPPCVLCKEPKEVGIEDEMAEIDVPSWELLFLFSLPLPIDLVAVAYLTLLFNQFSVH